MTVPAFDAPAPRHSNDNGMVGSDMLPTTMPLPIIRSLILFPVLAPLLSAATLTPESVLRYTFSVSPQLSYPAYMDLVFYKSNPSFPSPVPRSTLVASLYDADTLLGTWSPTVGLGTDVNGQLTTLVTIAAFASADPDNRHPDDTVADLSTLLDGTIQGRIDVSISASSLDLSNEALAGLVLALGDADCSCGNFLQPNFVGVVDGADGVPEVSSLVLSATGMVLLLILPNRWGQQD
jgi:hypothetical protein